MFCRCKYEGTYYACFELPLLLPFYVYFVRKQYAFLYLFLKKNIVPGNRNIEVVDNTPLSKTNFNSAN